ncbi:tRNA adenosine deaminase [Actinoalloteichus sp. AHMU CJ021]|uniref:tRNA adenosine deaminase-associated protein n=1 Tax=Actinoalloteichus caeruleus DSM 43889 TaxID=1120930 RepID=A0ABT1JJU2_ACTCY|nr:tRNA adenosine deaminase-associated protein [Actinoalloteichus caeruleus]AUS78646.1 tRNA adenosine deaminase [Actinoalloteichus sp. AHMU CJ021]MCP2332783.1 putative tRNA adenosine deaminase-associated protein [Actinoalloteichus caeruleus DSM 43889]
MEVEEPLSGVALAVLREDGQWRCRRMSDGALSDLDRAITELRATRSTGAVFGLLNVDDEFFLIVRPGPGGVDLLLSDSAAALYYDVAADVLDLLRIDPPDEDDDEMWPEGDLGLLADLGMPSGEMVVVVEEDRYPEEQLRIIAQRCGFADQYDAVMADLDRVP